MGHPRPFVKTPIPSQKTLPPSLIPPDKPLAEVTPFLIPGVQLRFPENSPRLPQALFPGPGGPSMENPLAARPKIRKPRIGSAFGIWVLIALAAAHAQEGKAAAAGERSWGNRPKPVLAILPFN